LDFITALLASASTGLPHPVEAVPHPLHATAAGAGSAAAAADTKLPHSQQNFALGRSALPQLVQGAPPPPAALPHAGGKTTTSAASAASTTTTLTAGTAGWIAAVGAGAGNAADKPPTPSRFSDNRSIVQCFKPALNLGD
jgi:hypothetical protein